MSVRQIRVSLAADPQVGAGNVLSARMALGIGLDQPMLAFDTELDGVPVLGGRSPYGELDRPRRARAAALAPRLRDRPAGPGGGAPPRARPARPCSATLALTRLGAIPALVNPRLDPAGKAARYIRRLTAVGVLADPSGTARSWPPNQGTPRHAAAAGDRLARPPATRTPSPSAYRHAPQDPVAITHSSGTTGLPQGCPVHSHDSLYAAVPATAWRLPRPAGPRTGCSAALPAAHASRP